MKCESCLICLANNTIFHGWAKTKEGWEGATTTAVYSVYIGKVYIWGYIIEYDNSIYIYHGIHMIIIYI